MRQILLVVPLAILILSFNLPAHAGSPVVSSKFIKLDRQMLNPQPLPPKNPDIRMLNPQPLPPKNSDIWMLNPPIGRVVRLAI
jgi:hypothetical protein